MDVLKRTVQSPIGKGPEAMNMRDQSSTLSPFRASLRKMEDHGVSPDKFRQWKHNLSPFSKRVIEELSNTSPMQKLIHGGVGGGGEVKMRIPDSDPTHSVGSLAASLRTKYGKRKRNLLFQEREFEPVDLSISLVLEDWKEDSVEETCPSNENEGDHRPKQKIRKTELNSDHRSTQVIDGHLPDGQHFSADTIVKDSTENLSTLYKINR